MGIVINKNKVVKLVTCVWMHTQCYRNMSSCYFGWYGDSYVEFGTWLIISQPIWLCLNHTFLTYNVYNVNMHVVYWGVGVSTPRLQ
jgi:hypothetical protein